MSTDSGCRDRLAIASSLATILALVVAVLALIRAMLNVTWPLGWSAENLWAADSPTLTITPPLPTATLTLTRTPLPATATPTPTLTTLPPTDTPKPAVTPTQPTATPAASGTVTTTTPLTTPVAGADAPLHIVQTPVLLKPSPDDQLDGQVLFQWQWDNQPLPEGIAFDLLIWSEQEHEEHQGAQALGVIEPGQELESEVDLDYVQTIVDHGEGLYYWIVIVVQQEPYERVGAWGEPRVFHYRLPAPPEAPTDATPAPP